MEKEEGEEEMWWGLNLLAETACFVAEDDGLLDQGLMGFCKRENSNPKWSLQVNSADLLCFDVDKTDESVMPKRRRMVIGMEWSRASKKARSDRKRKLNNNIPLLVVADWQRKRKGLKRQRLECNSNAEVEARKLKKLKQVPTITNFPIPEKLKNAIQLMSGIDIVLVIQKRLHTTDLNTNNGRLSIPSKQLSGVEFLTPEEKDKLDKNIRMEVLLLEPCLDKTTLLFRKWKMTTSFTYNLLKNWNSVASKQRNQLDVGGLVQLYSFRLQSKLCFALVNAEETQQLISNHHDASECAASSSISSAIAHELD